MTGSILDTAGSLHRLTPEEKALAEPLSIQLVTARAGDTFAKLAGASRISNHAQAMPRLINNKYPRGQAVPGEKIKTVNNDHGISE
ncbi:MAG TPA: hypothetical protein VK138_00715 [Acidiferrobacterales bacterium]|nr:hypothetical protein [Acidiferrobacterales bacterium]